MGPNSRPNSFRQQTEQMGPNTNPLFRLVHPRFSLSLSLSLSADSPAAVSLSLSLPAPRPPTPLADDKARGLDSKQYGRLMIRLPIAREGPEAGAQGAGAVGVGGCARLPSSAAGMRSVSSTRLRCAWTLWAVSGNPSGIPGSIQYSVIFQPR